MRARIAKRHRYARHRLALAGTRTLTPMSNVARLAAIDALKRFPKVQGISNKTINQWIAQGRNRQYQDNPPSLSS